MTRSELARHLLSPDAGERAIAAFLLNGKRLRPIEIRRLRTLLDDVEPQVQDAAAQTLGSGGIADAVPDIIRVIETRPPRDVWGAAWGLAQIGMTEPAAAVEVRSALTAWRRRARGRSRQHADLLLKQLANIG